METVKKTKTTKHSAIQAPALEAAFKTAVTAPEDIKNQLAKSLNAFFIMVDEYTEKNNGLQVTDHTDKPAMANAKAYRLELKKYRLEADAFIKSKRADVQERMAAFTAEDKAWLKAFQMIESKFKALEGELEYKEKYAEIWEAEQAVKRAAERKELLEPYRDVLQFDFMDLGGMAQAAFDVMLSGARTSLMLKIQEDERRAKMEAELLDNRRQLIIMKCEAIGLLHVDGNKYGYKDVVALDIAELQKLEDSSVNILIEAASLKILKSNALAPPPVLTLEPVQATSTMTDIPQAGPYTRDKERVSDKDELLWLLEKVVEFRDGHRLILETETGQQIEADVNKLLGKIALYLTGKINENDKRLG